jgi:hypothetical protein
MSSYDGSEDACSKLDRPEYSFETAVTGVSPNDSATMIEIGPWDHKLLGNPIHYTFDASHHLPDIPPAEPEADDATAEFITSGGTTSCNQSLLVHEQQDRSSMARSRSNSGGSCLSLESRPHTPHVEPKKPKRSYVMVRCDYCTKKDPGAKFAPCRSLTKDGHECQVCEWDKDQYVEAQYCNMREKREKRNRERKNVKNGAKSQLRKKEAEQEIKRERHGTDR